MGPCQQLECQSRVRIRFLRLQSDRTLHIRNKGPRDGLVKSRISMADTPTAAPYVRLIIKTDREPKFAAASLTAALRGEMLAISLTVRAVWASIRGERMSVRSSDDSIQRGALLLRPPILVFGAEPLAVRYTLTARRSTL